MNVRVHLGLLVTYCWLAVGSAFAQGPYGQPAPIVDPNFQPAGWHHGHRQQCPEPCVDQNTIYQLLPDDRGLSELHSRINWNAIKPRRGSWIRFDYINAEIHRNRSNALGQPFFVGQPLVGDGITAVTRDLFVADVRDQFDLFFPDINPDPDPLLLTSVPVQVPQTGGVEWNGMNGVRGEIGIPLDDHWTLEASAWGLEDAGDSLNVPDIPASSVLGANGIPRTQMLATTLTTDGAPGSRIMVYDQAFFSEYTADMWSSEINLAYDLRIPHDGWSLQSLIGFRQTEYGENLRFGGSFDNSSGYLDLLNDVTPLGTLATPISNSFQSKVRNYRNELQLGLRSELAHKYFTLGIAPKVGLGGNLIRSKVIAQNAREPGDPGIAFGLPLDDPDRTVTSDRELEFSPTLDLGLYADIHLREWCKLRVGYNVTWLGRLGVAERSIKFDETTDNTDPMNPITNPNVVLDRALRDRVVTAFTIGGEIYLP